jgi:hypothetical protein
MKTSKEKAEELFQLYLPFVESGHIEEMKYRCKLSALIAVDEVLDAIVIINEYDFEPLNEYWQEVKQEIEKL